MLFPTLTVLIAALASTAAAVVATIPTKQQLIDTVNKSGSIGRKDCPVHRFAHRAVRALGREFVKPNSNLNCVVTGYPYTAKGPQVGLLALQIQFPQESNERTDANESVNSVSK